MDLAVEKVNLSYLIELFVKFKPHLYQGSCSAASESGTLEYNDDLTSN